MLPDFLFASETTHAPLRIGLIVDDAALPQFVAEAIGYITRSTLARIELVIVRRVAAQPSAPVLYRLYAQWDRRHVTPSDDPLRPVSVRDVVPNVEVTDEGSTRIRAAALDVILHCGTTPIHGDILNAARHGVWNFELGEHNAGGRSPAFFWEMRDGAPMSSLVLRRLSGGSSGDVLSKAVVSTEAGLSQTRNTLRPCWGGTSLLIRTLREVYERGQPAGEGQAATGHEPAGRHGAGPPTNVELAAWLVPDVGRRLVRRLRRLGQSPTTFWRMAVRVGGRAVASGPTASLDGFRWVDAPKGRFFADPFVIREEGSGSPWVFFEDYDYRVRRGRLSCAPVGAGGSLGEIQSVLDKPYHLSYPYVFRHDAALFMIPETRGAGRIDLYRCTRFPDCWEFERTLVPLAGLDSSIWIENGRCWLFTTLTTPRATAPQLWLFTAESLAGPWRVHPASPISTDVRNARSAGAIFRHGGRLVRPSQDCSIAYGYSFTLNEIVELSPDRFHERPLVTVGPDWSPGLVGTHSYAVSGDVEFVDGCSIVPASQVGAE